MHISHLVIKNFRAIEDVQFDLQPRMNVIVGPNAIGKTTVLQALRLPKALVAPRTENEAQQTLISLGAASPHFPNRILLSALARDRSKAVEVRCKYVLTDNEIEKLAGAMPVIANNFVQSSIGRSFANPTALIQFLNSEQGKERYSQGLRDLDKALREVSKTRSTMLGVSMRPDGAQIETTDPAEAALISYLDQRLEPHLSVFSYFPADRAMPVGEVPVQLGAADTQQQLESHNSQPQLKYARLKNTIFGSIIRGDADRASLMKEFDEIFAALINGRRVVGAQINELGLLSIIVEELESKRQFEIDNLSSGEKGLILTFLLIAKTVAKGGIVLIDEPELHLNPAVCRDVLMFMVDHCAVPNDLQFIICSHSPQILASAFESDVAALHHLESPTQISRVGRRAYDELADALQKLGTSVSESLMYKGTILVEGDDDERLLNEGFPEQLRRYKISDRGGRKEIEKTVAKLQELEKKGEKVDPIFLIFDHDNVPTNLLSSNSVKIMQWNRYCLENYLIDIEAITHLLKAEDVARNPGARSGEVTVALRDLAFQQLDEIAIRAAYSDLNYLGPNFQLDDIEGRPPSEAAQRLYSRISQARASLPDQNEVDWATNFLQLQSKHKMALEASWETDWRERCNGKRLFADFQRSGRLKISTSAFKRRIIQQMKSSNSDSWAALSGLLTKFLAS